MGGQSFGDVLAELRLAMGYSQNRVARAAGCDHSHISRLETGQRQPSRAVVLRLAAALGLSADGRDRLLLAAGLLPDDVLHAAECACAGLRQDVVAGPGARELAAAAESLLRALRVALKGEEL